MIDNQEKLNKLIDDTIKDANECLKSFKLIDNNVNLYGLPCLTRWRDFEVESLYDDFLKCYCDKHSSLVGEALYYSILSLFSSKNAIKIVDYLSEDDISKIKQLNPKYCLGKIKKDDCECNLPEEFKNIKEIYEPHPLDENKDYVVFVKDETSAGIAFNFCRQFNAYFLHLASSIEDIDKNLSLLYDESILSAKNEQELFQRANTKYCRLYFSFCYTCRVDKSAILVYKVNRTTRQKKNRRDAIRVKIVK